MTSIKTFYESSTKIMISRSDINIKNYPPVNICFYDKPIRVGITYINAPINTNKFTIWVANVVDRLNYPCSLIFVNRPVEYK